MSNKMKFGAVFLTAVLVFAVSMPILAGAQTTSTNAVDNQNATIDSIVHDLATGKINAPPGAKDCSNETPKLRVTPQLAPKPTNSTLTPMDTSGISAGYQCFGSPSTSFCGEITGYTNSIQNLLDQTDEYAVLHEWGWVVAQGTDNENCVVVSRSGSTAIFSIKIGSLGGYQDWWNRPTSDTFYIQLMPMNTAGSIKYTQINVFIWDITTNEYFSKPYFLPVTEHLGDGVDAALEQGTQWTPNSQWFNFYQVNVYDQNLNLVNLQNNYYWKEWSFPQMNNVHSESYQNTPNGPYTQATLWQEKTPK